MDTLLLLLPDLALIATGAVLVRATRWGDGFWSGLEKLVYQLLFPALIVVSLASNRFDPAQAAPFAAAVAAVLAAGVALGWLAARITKPEPRRFASAVQCAFRFNSYLALALSQRLGGEAGVALCAVVVAVAVPLGNAAAVWHLARHGGNGVVRELVRNPLIVATAIGLAINLVDASPPAPVMAYLSRLGPAAIALGLIAVGAGLQSGGARGDTGFATACAAVKLVAMPMLALALVHAMALPPLHAQVLVLYAAVPSASACYILAVRMGGDGPYVARLVTATTVASAVAIPFWLAWVR